MKPYEIGEYSGCAHGPNGSRLFGCIPCAIQWHTARHVDFADRAKYHMYMARKLEDEQISRNLAKAEAMLAASEASELPPPPASRKE